MVDADSVDLGKRLLLWAVVATALAAVFMAYLQPAMVVDLANRFWSCF